MVSGGTSEALAGLTISESEVMARLSPYVSESYARESSEGRALVKSRSKNLVHMIALMYWRQIRRQRREKTNRSVREHYERNYGETEFYGHGVVGRPVTYLYGGHVLKMSGMGSAVSKCLVIEKCLRLIRPSKVCELGCGQGPNLFALAAAFPDMRFFGIDLIPSAIAAANRARNKEDIQAFYPNFGGHLSEAQLESIRRVEFSVGNAMNLSDVEENSFDVTYTIDALEQMRSGLPDALRELKRITKDYVIMCEPFLKYNDFLGRIFLSAGNYFRENDDLLGSHGLEVVTHMNCLPVKPTFAYSVVVAKVVK